VSPVVPLETAVVGLTLAAIAPYVKPLIAQVKARRPEARATMAKKPVTSSAAGETPAAAPLSILDRTGSDG